MLKNNEKKAGCTVHYVNEKLDSGRHIIQKNFTINKKDNENFKEKNPNVRIQSIFRSNNQNF